MTTPPEPPTTCPGCGVRLVEPPLHRPRPCPSCGQQSWAVREGACLHCRHARSDHREIA